MPAGVVRKDGLGPECRPRRPPAPRRVIFIFTIHEKGSHTMRLLQILTALGQYRPPGKHKRMRRVPRHCRKPRRGGQDLGGPRRPKRSPTDRH